MFSPAVEETTTATAEEATEEVAKTNGSSEVAETANGVHEKATNGSSEETEKSPEEAAETTEESEVDNLNSSRFFISLV